MRFTIPETVPRAALITGGVRQYGMAQILAEAGFAIALQCEPGAVEEPPAGAIVLHADLCDEDHTSGLMIRAVEAVGPIGVLINAASTSNGETGGDPGRATWDKHMGANLRAPFVLIQQFARMLPSGREGAVINLLDQRIDPHRVAYTVSQAALWTLTQTMALALAPRIRVNGLSHGRTPRPRQPGAAVKGQDRLGEPRAIGRAAIAILALRSMTGQIIVPDGILPPGA